MTESDETNHDLSGFRPDIFALKAQKATSGKELPPVHLWNPDFCGDIDMRIRRDGSWDYMGTPITRKRMVKLFSTILRRDGKDFFLITPVEKVGIKVDDAPFTAIEMDINADHIIFKTNVDDYVTADDEHPIKVIIDVKTGEPSPYIRVRDSLDALITRSVFYQLADIAVEHDGKHGVWSGGCFFPLDA
ncbi:MAG: DUF1285 domain-containing protein [Emcibacteraceae bacterium]|nr:DUF1285 domain-containing protein [Emcibacteraceae bacterium]